MEDNAVVLDLNEFTVADFINFFYEFYIVDLSGDLVINFFGDCDFRVTILKRWIMISLNSQHLEMLNLLRRYPYSLRMDYTYCFCKTEPTFLLVEDFQILRDIWKLHSDIRRIEMTKQNITFVRFAPKRLTSLCMTSIEDTQLSTLPAHVVKSLKELNVDPSSDTESDDEEIGKCFKFLEHQLH
ncbi:hypothetical protein JTE90_018611 [Oedothorax gibbosus]|uniref:Uncharacterized protein n=1 Tax=Oedothorax gibbosus TaxID=931172 RepID=A0AAV6UNP3_9ARAC|nr:hypothetical protein JTE90_018611 [Oedothorax gibbosus]